MLLSNKTSLRRAKPLLGTIVDITLNSTSYDTDALGVVMNKCFQRIKEIQSRMSYFEAGSDIFRINYSKPNEVVTISQETAYVLKLGLKLYDESKGSFDILYKGRANNPKSWIKFHENNKVSRSQFTEIDLGGIAKGYAADEAALTASETPRISGVINAGGDIVFFGTESFPLAIRSPKLDGKFFEAGEYSSCAIATSVFYRDRLAYSISVLASKCVIADSLTKALWQQNEEDTDFLLSQYKAKYMELDSDLILQNGALLN